MCRSSGRHPADEDSRGLALFGSGEIGGILGKRELTWPRTLRWRQADNLNRSVPDDFALESFGKLSGSEGHNLWVVLATLPHTSLLRFNRRSPDVSEAHHPLCFAVPNLQPQAMVSIHNYPNITVSYEKLLALEREGIASFPEFAIGKVIDHRLLAQRLGQVGYERTQELFSIEKNVRELCALLL